MAEKETNIFSLEPFLRLTETLTLQVDAGVNEFHLLLTVLGGGSPGPGKEKALLSAVRFLLAGYGRDRRKNGTLAVLHPLRVGAFVARISPRLNIYDVLAAFLHDADEDLSEETIGQARCAALLRELDAVYEIIGADERWYLGERLGALTRKEGQCYFEYLLGILGHARAMPNLLHIKLADKIDSLLDNQILLPSEIYLDFDKIIFETLFVPTRSPIPGAAEGARFGEDDGVLLLSSLGKALMFLSLLRSGRLDRLEPTTGKLTDQLVQVAIEQTKWVLLHHLRTKIPDLMAQRGIIRRTLEYCERPGALSRVTSKDEGGILDGTIIESFAIPDDAERKARLRKLYRDPAQFAELLLALIALLSCFQRDDFVIDGIDWTGIRPGAR